ncbi:hypothetical protein PNH38_12515 [Anoxybacillus rupiensis]|jgi:hypothetical protein|uniref:Uncharacterized protein n=1 Tax=Anoxybacteroides rupiense TaxID=311460 RepID=A0ABD5ISF0_9BACL|nr:MULTISPECIES: hypothetical protein [Anoxybacillus]KXG08837.1 hypothetical protein AT864_02945 [Anoxybacillus sp. P3H1B]MDE8564685.1 hypothetical protein [Anoxybacillus rupiensis]MED5051213.1 hypothetical protein [Anoxybacillus rupiensis]QHC05119.1 hypothetical protein GRQ40_14915 [Anoxybacillus sp. PDR2]
MSNYYQYYYQQQPYTGGFPDYPAEADTGYDNRFPTSPAPSGFPGGFPGGHPGPSGTLEQRLNRMERTIERQGEQINRLNRRLQRVERRLGIPPTGQF